jgi:cytosine/adenosine deaminase-related metal-dependent hydrolase
MSRSISVSGHALIGRDLIEREACITIQDGIITAIDEISRAPDLWLCPGFFNAHTHLADTIALDIPASGSLKSLVAPPDGLKHRLLRSAPSALLKDAMSSSIQLMERSGIAGFADFREGGVEGVNLLREAAVGFRGDAVIFGRDGGEMTADGVGISSAGEYPDIEEIVRRARANGKLVAFHAGEKDPRDVDEALSYEPDCIVHATHATIRQLQRCADEGIPIVVCPRSNWILGVAGSATHPPIQRMVDLGCTVLLGTDNVMFAQPDMFQEMAFLSCVYKIQPVEILRMAIQGSVLCESPYYIEKGNAARISVIDPARGNLMYSRDMHASLVKRVHFGYFERIIF